jgi:hypothetical protein
VIFGDDQISLEYSGEKLHFAVVSGASGQLLHGKVTKSSTGPMIQL